MKKIVTIITTIMIFAASLMMPLNVRADETITRISGKTSALGMEFTYNYDDTFFATKSTEVCWPLADMSLVMATASATMPDLSKLYKDIGLRNVEFNDGYTGEDKTDNVAVGIGSKTINVNGRPESLIVMTVRGVNYKLEWSNNFKVGTKGDHEGFDNNSDKVYEFLEEYMSDHKLESDVKIWIQGYSRGGALSYLTAKKLIERNVFEEDSMFVYTFNAPNGSVDKKPYKCIHNIVNNMDVVQRMFPAEWGFGRDGETITLGDPKKISELKKTDHLKTTNPYAGLKFEVRYLNMSTAWGDGGLFDEKAKDQYDVITYYTKLINFLQKGPTNDSVDKSRSKKGLDPIPTLSDRATYYSQYQETFEYLFEYIYGQSTNLEGVSKNFEANTASFVVDLVLECYSKNQDYPDTSKVIEETLAGKNAAAKPDHAHVVNILRLAGKILRGDTKSDSALGTSFGQFTMLATMFGNLDYIKNGHMPDVMLAWIRHDHPEVYRAVNVDFQGETDPEDLPVLTGENMYKDNANVTVTATFDEEKYIFNGWFDAEGNLISSDVSTSFVVNRDTDIYADFELVPLPTPTSTPTPTPVELKKNDMKELIERDIKTGSPVIWICVGAGAALLGGIIGIIIYKKKKKKD